MHVTKNLFMFGVSMSGSSELFKEHLLNMFSYVFKFVALRTAWTELILHRFVIDMVKIWFCSFKP